jgi:murein DD-endopeptidase MepM/ murein hydrolase activator NlpD
MTPTGDWGWPLSPRPVVVHGFWIGPAPWSPGHRGVDLAAATGAAVHAPAAGVVRFAGVIAGRGVVTIDHGSGTLSSFEPALTSLRPGDTVRRGQRIGVLRPPPSGRTHCSPQTCLHWGVRRNGVYVDPLTYLAAHGPAVLLPLGHP